MRGLMGLAKAPVALGTIVAATIGMAGCMTDEADQDLVDPSEEPGAEPGAGDLGPGVAADVDPVAVEEDGRPYVVRADGGRIPLLTADELLEMHAPVETTGAEAFNVFAVPPASYDLSAYQTPVKDQMDRGTCGTFATVAAIEAAYRRIHGVTLDLSEQYMFHVAKSTGVSYPRIFQYENQSSYWYGGGWPTTQYMLPTEASAPYAGYRSCPSGTTCTPLDSIPGASALVWAADPAENRVTQQQVDDFEYSPLHIPAAARNTARYGVASFSDYSATDARNTTLLETLISSNKEVIISVDTKWKTLPSGILDWDPTATGGGHVVLLIGYDRTAGYFLVKNSWGGTAPAAYLKFSYNFVRNAAYGAATVNSVVSPSSSAQAKAKWIGKWYQDHEGWRGTMVVRRITPVSNSAVRLGTYYASGSYASGHSVNGLSLDGNRGLRYYVASETENAPGTLTGQRFEADQYDWTPEHAAGTVWWGTTGEGGVRLGRSSFSMPYSNTFATSEWVGTWDVNNNGNTGVLTITSVTATSGDYVVNASLVMGGVSRTITGTVERARPTIAHFVVDGVNNYTLHYHFWEDRLASGSVTRTGVVRNGVHAVRR